MSKANLATLVVTLGANSAQLVEQLKTTKNSAKEWASSMKGIASKAGVAFFGAVAGAGAAGAGFIAIVERQAAQIDALAKKADKLGLGTVALQRLEYQAELTGVSQDTLGTALQRMTRRVAEAAQGSGEAKKAIAELGLSATQLAQMSPDQQFYAIAEAMKAIPVQGDRIKLAMRIFDTEGVGLVNTFAANLQDLGKEFDALGVGITRQQAAAVEAYNDAKTKLSTIFGGFFNNVTAEVAPAFQLIVSKIGETIEKMGGVREAAQQFGRGVVNIVAVIVKSFGRMLEAVGEVAKVINYIRQLTNTAQFGVGKAIEAMGKYTFIGRFTDAENAGAGIADNATETMMGLMSQRQSLEEFNQKFDDYGGKVDAWSEEIKASIGKTVEQIGTTNSNTAAVTQNTQALIAQKAALEKQAIDRQAAQDATKDKAVESSSAWEKIFGTPKDEKKQGDKIDTNFSKAAQEYQRAMANGATGTAEAAAERMKQIIESYQKNPFGHSNLSGPSKIGGAWGVSTGRADEHDVTGMQAVMQKLLSGEGAPKMGSVTINLKKEDGRSVSGEMTADQAFARQLLETLGPVAAATGR